MAVKEICKNQNCDYTFPINDTECAGNSLSSINYNFRSLDEGLCSFENRATSNWNPAFTIFSQNSAAWLNASTVMSENSSCWNLTYNTVSELSGFWLKPITIIYPFPFPSTTDIATITLWLNENFPVRNGNCYNFIVGQQLYVMSAEYGSANRVVSDTKGSGNQVVSFAYTCDCIGRGQYTGYASKVINCGTFTFTASIPDTYVNKFVGIKYTVDASLQWANGTKIFG
jgi:hypothetical protein